MHPYVTYSEKASSEPLRRRSQRSKSLPFAFLLLASVLYLHTIYPPAYAAFSGLFGRSDTLEWKGCGTIAGHNLECARLKVPLNHDDKEDSRTISIPLIRLLGRNATKTILLNPGGPGGSGFEFVHRRGEQLSNIVGEGYDLLSFDPRGVNGSLPRAKCFPSEAQRYEEARSRPEDIWEESGRFAAQAANLARACQDVMGEVGKYINTPQTAADMNHILDAIHQPKMLYWGFSYGTTLGQTYAQMFPDRVHRLIIDGVSNQDQWYAEEAESEAEAWHDTQAVWRDLAYNCFDAGKACPLSQGFSSKEELYNNVTDLILSLKDAPQQVYINASSYGILTYHDVYDRAILPALYKPTQWPILVADLADFVQGNATSLYMKYAAKRYESDSTASETSYFVQIGDSARHDPSKKKPEAALLAQLEKVGDAAPMLLSDFAWEAHVYNEWLYPRSHNFTPAVEVETAQPILILSTILDPICPLISAQAANKKYRKSVLLQQRGSGHCSVSMPSKCMKQHVQAFFDHGTMPAEGTICDIDIPYFPDPDSDYTVSDTDDLVRLARQSVPLDGARV